MDWGAYPVMINILLAQNAQPLEHAMAPENIALTLTRYAGAIYHCVAYLTPTHTHT